MSRIMGPTAKQCGSNTASVDCYLTVVLVFVFRGKKLITYWIDGEPVVEVWHQSCCTEASLCLNRVSTIGTHLRHANIAEMQSKNVLVLSGSICTDRLFKPECGTFWGQPFCTNWSKDVLIPLVGSKIGNHTVTWCQTMHMQQWQVQELVWGSTWHVPWLWCMIWNDFPTTSCVTSTSDYTDCGQCSYCWLTSELVVCVCLILILLEALKATRYSSCLHSIGESLVADSRGQIEAILNR